MGKVKTQPEAVESAPLPVYLAIVGLTTGASKANPDGVRIEPGGIVPDAVVERSPWLLTDGWVRIQKEAANV